jgi:ABC-type sugar transport system permease subunit
MTRLLGGAGVGWWFVAPALLVIVVFFFAPVAAAFLLSFTDFDIYAVATSAIRASSGSRTTPHS